MQGTQQRHSLPCTHQLDVLGNKTRWLVHFVREFFCQRKQPADNSLFLPPLSQTAIVKKVTTRGRLCCYYQLYVNTAKCIKRDSATFTICCNNCAAVQKDKSFLQVREGRCAAGPAHSAGLSPPQHRNHRAAHSCCSCCALPGPACAPTPCEAVNTRRIFLKATMHYPDTRPA